MKQTVFKLSVFIFILFSNICFGQTQQIENLKKEISVAKTKTDKIRAIFLLCELCNSTHPDTIFSYASKAEKLAIKIANKHAEI